MFVVIVIIFSLIAQDADVIFAAAGGAGALDCKNLITEIRADLASGALTTGVP